MEEVLLSLEKEKSNKYLFSCSHPSKNIEKLLPTYKTFCCCCCCFVKHVRMHLKPINDDSDLWE